MVYVYDDIDDFNIVDFEKLYNKLSDERKEKVNKYKFMQDKKLSMISYLLLLAALKLEYNIKDDIIFKYNIYGKPYLKKYSNIYFNISHCKKGIICALSSNEIGVDIQDFIDFDDNILEYIMCNKEINRISKSEKTKKDFINLWTLKESYIKYLGIGLNYDLKSLNFSTFSQGTFKLYDCHFQLKEYKNYSFSICSHQIETIKFLSKAQLINNLY